MKVCCFIGHRKIDITEKLVISVKNIVQTLIENEGVKTFAFGGRGQFDELCHDIVSQLMKKYSGIERVCVSCAGQYVVLEEEREKWEKIRSDVLKQEVHLRGYEREIDFKTKYSSCRAAYVERNQALVDMSDFCVFYYDKNYLPPKRKAYKKALFPYQPKSGTALAYNYTQRKKKRIINLF